ncbi:TPA: Asp-tRNA(Asn)/Glu-tRNA(Gln) amidotransferase subunit GatA, partial [Candidatus Poribacteria bacterium]|nr:Asp-tRNA(Asn)/Glu-tRNA(Gln) amidotransferase subunit GatA [Candidatus Poribacteria bacterium]HEX29613.1 Asp-tRNA(Asn)/Glu-tRNA(Gln) amidotransferase subunit GatA [Candidatus Poribacteria bacterium]
MELYSMTAHQLRDLLRKGEVSATDIVKSVLERIDEVEEKIKAYITITDDLALRSAEKVDELLAKGEELPDLAGIPVAIKDVICTKGVLTTCASKILYNFVPPYDATVMVKLNRQMIAMIGKANMDEFAMGSSTENSGFFITHNPWDLDRVPG